jgi:hypothetical protein
MPYFSPMMARLPSRPTEKVAPHRLALDAQQQGQRQAQRQGTEGMAEFLEHQGPAGLAHIGEGGADRQAELDDEQQQAGVEQAAGIGLEAGVDACQRRRAARGDAPGRRQQQGPQHRQQHHLARAELELAAPISSATATTTRATATSLNLPGTEVPDGWGASAAVAEVMEFDLWEWMPGKSQRKQPLHQ